MVQLPIIMLIEAEGHFCCFPTCNTHNSGNIVCVYSVFTHKLESAHDLWYNLYCQRWRTSQGHRRSRTLEKMISWKRSEIEML